MKRECRDDDPESSPKIRDQKIEDNKHHCQSETCFFLRNKQSFNQCQNRKHNQKAKAMWRVVQHPTCSLFGFLGQFSSPHTVEKTQIDIDGPDTNDQTTQLNTRQQRFGLMIRECFVEIDNRWKCKENDKYQTIPPDSRFRPRENILTTARMLLSRRVRDIQNPSEKSLVHDLAFTWSLLKITMDANIMTQPRTYATART